ncbi:hypothetical protein HWV62_25078 [Athelia sp. TMB]|nr:hypothetical protein HWV62_25078 [Athelia sp. TMB]
MTDQLSDHASQGSETYYSEIQESSDGNIAFHITREQFQADREATTRGTLNPSIMNKPFWKHMVWTGRDAYSARKQYIGPGKEFEELDGPDPNPSPVWCFHVRFGKTATRLPDGRIVYIAGEHEDWYDPDFCIYNDVIVVEPSCMPEAEVDTGACDRTLSYLEEPVIDFEPTRAICPVNAPDQITIYGYPLDVFLPTDFHTATYYAEPAEASVNHDDATKPPGKEFIYIIGGGGYRNDQHLREECLVYRLDLADFTIERQTTSGDGPPGISTRKDHKAKLVTGGIEITLMENVRAGEGNEDKDDGADGMNESVPVSLKKGKRYLLELPGLNWKVLESTV